MTDYMIREYDIIVVGAGHAGIEAALASSRRGLKTLMLTGNLDTIAQMSCNPAIGGLAKGHLVKEIDALGGEMGKTIDATGIHFKMLNKSKGPAVWAPRAQADKKNYQLKMKHALESEKNLYLIQDIVDERAKALTLFANDAVVLLIFFFGTEPAHFQSFGVKPDQREWGPQLMRDVRNKIGLQPGQRHFSAYIAIREHDSAGQ